MEDLSARDSDDYEDHCFICKENIGIVLMCDNSVCLKVYHTKCLGMDDKCIPEFWYCDLHSCFLCHKSSEFNCLCCTKALCRKCIVSAEFVQIRDIYGLCSVCLKRALYVEQDMTAHSDMGISHFGNYWKIVKEKENLTVENLSDANLRMKAGQWKASSFETIKRSVELEGKARSQDDIPKHVELEQKAKSLQEDITKHPGDIVANGEGARVRNQHSANPDDSEKIQFKGVLGDEAGKESSRDSVDKIQTQSPNLFPPVNSKRKKSRPVESEDTSFAQALDILEVMAEEMEEINPFTLLYHFSQQFLRNEDHRAIFFRARTNKIRLASLQYNYQVNLHASGI